MAAEKIPSPPGDWSHGNPAHAAQLASFRERYPLYARALDGGGSEDDRAAMQDAWHLWVTGGHAKASGRPARG